MQETRKYSNEDITVVWKPDACIHSTLCWKGLLEVFNPKVRPWIRMEGATTERIIDQVRKCPSGALSYFQNKPNKDANDKDDIASEAAKILTVRVIANGPYLLQTECVIVHSDGHEEIKKGSVSLCRCGASGNKPYCDGSHKQIGFKDG